MRHPLDDLAVDLDSQVGVAAQIRDRIALLVADRVLRPGDRLPPLREVADRLGVHVNTLRSAYAQLEAEGLLRTRHGVGTTIGEVDPAQLAALTWRGRSNAIGVLIAALEPFYTPMLQALEEVVADRGTLVAIADAQDSPERGAHLLRQLVARGVDGLIAVSVGELPASRAAAHDRLPPIVYVDQPDREGHVIVFETAAAGAIATRHLLDEGRRRIALLTLPDAFSNTAGLRSGYDEALHASAAAQPPWVVELEGFGSADARGPIAELLDRPVPPDALITASGTHALVALAEARARGLSVPRDLAVVGYGDTEPARLAHPSLSMIELPAREAGTLAASILEDLIARRTRRPQRHALSSRLIVRDSCGPHP